MLNKNHITDIQILSDDWFRGRLAKFTASEKHVLMGDKPDTVGAIHYIYRKVGEEITGTPCKDEVDTKATEWGKKYENEGIIEVGKKMGWQFVVTQKLIVIPDTRLGCTPDFLVLLNESTDKQFWNVETGEIKCPPSFDNYIAFARCKTPQDVYKVPGDGKKWFWQAVDQMNNCGALKGYLGIYNPMFKESGTHLNIVTFRKVELLKEFKLLNERNQWADDKFNEVRNEMLNIK